MAVPRFNLLKESPVRKLATVRQVKDVRPIDGADMIQLAVIDGWKCVVKKANFNQVIWLSTARSIRFCRFGWSSNFCENRLLSGCVMRTAYACVPLSCVGKFLKDFYCRST